MDQQITAVIVNRKEHKLKVCTLCLIDFKPIIYWRTLIITLIIMQLLQAKLTLTSFFLAQKGAGYHLDLFWVAILMMICSFMGLPWYVAATVISIAHIDSLKMETQTSAPGEQPKFLGVR